MQVAFDRSSERGGAKGMGIVPGAVHELEAANLKLPHIGWSRVHWQGDSPILRGLPRDVDYYHVHSYTCEPTQPDDIIGVAEYEVPFVSAVSHGSFTGVQFHPEKSSLDGLRLLANFVSVCVAAA
jgi:glutamine amidotransferase